MFAPQSGQEGISHARPSQHILAIGLLEDPPALAAGDQLQALDVHMQGILLCKKEGTQASAAAMIPAVGFYATESHVSESIHVEKMKGETVFLAKKKYTSVFEKV